MSTLIFHTKCGSNYVSQILNLTQDKDLGSMTPRRKPFGRKCKLGEMQIARKYIWWKFSLGLN